MRTHLLIALIAFIAYVRMPMQKEVRYIAERVEFSSDSTVYRLTLENGKIVVVPVMFTIIEER